MKAVLLFLIVVYAVYAAAMVWLHPRFIYPFQSDETVLPGFSRIEFARNEGLPIFAQEYPGEGPTVLYFMGNAGAVPLFATAFDRHIAAGRHVIVMEYRGGGGRPGIPSEARLKADALLAADYALSLGKPLIVQGYSLGTGLAAHVAARRDTVGVVLSAPYDKLCRLMAAASYLPACWLPVQRWRSIDDARNIAAPILVLHGSEDTLIPPQYSAAFADIPGVRRVIIEGAGHTDMGAFPAFDTEIDGFLADVLGT